MGNTVSLCMIVKNEKSNIELLMNEVCPILEQVVVVDTGSTDGTLEILQRLSQKYKNLEIQHFTWIKDFSAARNYSFGFAKHEFIYWLDGDDLVDPIELKVFKDNVLDNPEVDCWILDYIYSRNADGTPSTTLGRERFIRRSCNPRWSGAIHEAIDINSMRQRNYDKLKVIHERTGKVIEFNRNVEILESEYAKSPGDPRVAYYYGKELFDRINPKGVEVLEKYLQLPYVYWDDKINALHRVGRHYLSQKRHRDAIHCAEQIYHLDNTRQRAEGYFIYCIVEQDLGNFLIAIDWFKRCLVTPPPPPRVLTLEYYTWHPRKRIAECYKSLGNIPETLKWIDETVKSLPSDKELNLWAKNFRESCEVKETKPVNTEHTEYTILKPMTPEEQTQFFDTIPEKTIVKIPTSGNMIGGLEVLFVMDNFFVCVKPKQYSKTYNFSSGDENFGPYRIQIENFRRSVVRNGGRISTTNPDYYITNILNDKKGKTNVLMCCEWLPNSDYKVYGIDLADIVLCSSTKLMENMRNKFPNKKIDVLIDHAEMTKEQWIGGGL